MIRVEPTTAAPATGVTRPSSRAPDAAAGFEQLLVQQLAEALVATTQDEDAEGGAAGSMLAQLLPDAIAQSIRDAGGLGLAAQLAPPEDAA